MKLDHKNIISIKEIITSKPSKFNTFKRSTFIVMEYMEHDFAGIMMKN